MPSQEDTASSSPGNKDAVVLHIRPGPPRDGSPGQAQTKGRKKTPKVVEMWAMYIIDDTLAENWGRFLHDLGLGDFKTKTQCKKALKNKWINIHDFLAAVKKRDAAAEKITTEQERVKAMTAPVGVVFFESEQALARYTRMNHKVYPRKKIGKESPLKLLLARILSPRGH